MSTNPKATRSRYSSPLHPTSSPSGHNRASANNANRTFMQRWLEPPVQNKASYQEAGLMKAGVVENMAPLGTLPKAAIAKKSGVQHGGDAHHGSATPVVKKIVLKKPKASTEVAAATVAIPDDVNTPPPVVPGTSPDVEEAEVIILSPSSRPYMLPVVDDGEDDDYVPKKSTSKPPRLSFGSNSASQPQSLQNIQNANMAGVNAAASSRRQSSRRKSARPSPPPSAAPAAPAASSPIPTAASVSTPASPTRPQPAPSSTTPSRFYEEQLEVDKIIEQAVEHALEHCRYPTAYALRNLYDEKTTDPSFIRMIKDVHHQRADPATLRDFARLIREKKKYGKKHNYAFEYFVPDEIPIPKPRPAPYAALVTMDLSVFKEVAPDADGRATKKIKVEKPSDTPPRPLASVIPNKMTDARISVDPMNPMSMNSRLALRPEGTPRASTPVTTGFVTTPKPIAATTAAPVMPAVHTPTIHTPAIHTPAIQTPTFQAHMQAHTAQTHTTQMPTTQTPTTQTPTTQTPAIPTPTIPKPTAQVPATQIPAVQAPAQKAPAVPAPVVQAPAVKAPAVRAPPAEAPATKNLAREISSIFSAAPAMKPTTTSSRPNGTKNTRSPRGKKKRTGSVSSISSLSSVPDDVPEDFEEFMDQVDDDLAVSRPRSAEGNDTPNPAGSTQPISAPQKKSAAKRKHASPKPPTHASTTHNTPAAATTNGTSHHQGSRQTPASSLKFPSRFGDPDFASKSWASIKLEKRAENRRLTTTTSADSFVRDGFVLNEPPEQEVLPAAQPPPPVVVATPAEPPPRPVRTPALSSRAARAAKRNHDEMDDSISPTAASFQSRLEASSSRRNSRAATPSNMHPAKKPRGGLRVKTSPTKKKGTSAGIPRGGGERPSPAANGALTHQDDNDDSCYTCGGNGELVCCDGCTYSFHFLCIDPPMSEGHMPDEWYCNECLQRFCPPIGERQGAFSDLLLVLERKNPRSFRLPEDVRGHFEGVKTGPEGEYEDTATAPKPNKSKKGYEESFDFFRVKNPDGTPALCHPCHKAAADDRPLIPCSIPGCGLNWHLECLDPPLAVPPPPRTWRCPAHVDDLLCTLPGRLAPAHKYRKVKHAPIIEQIYSRGMANNGYIEIEEDSDDDDEDDAWRHQKGYGRVFRVPEKGVKLDFLERVHENRSKTPAQTATPNPAFTVAPSARTVADQQAALILSQLAQSGNDSTNGVKQLIGALVSEASPAIVAMMANGDAERIVNGNLASADVTSLNAMLAQVDSLKSAITKVLASRAHPATPGAHPATPAETPEKKNSAAASDLLSGEGATLDLSRSAKVHSAAAQGQAGDKKSAGAGEDSTMQVD